MYPCNISQVRLKKWVDSQEDGANRSHNGNSLGKLRFKFYFRHNSHLEFAHCIQDTSGFH